VVKEKGGGMRRDFIEGIFVFLELRRFWIFSFKENSVS